jgi:DNA-directed RNA polymerase subunit RPC12/RpoP
VQKEEVIMKNWFRNLGYQLRTFMQGRYGYDEFSRFLSITGIVLLFLSYIPFFRFLYFLAFVLIIWAYGRAFSKNIYKRQMERYKYLAIQNKVRQKFMLRRNIWRERKTHKYYKCPHCKAFVRISKPEKGKTIVIQCPKCGQEIIKKI